MATFLPRMARRVLPAAIALSASAGCALSTRNAILIYPPTPSSSGVAVAQAAEAPTTNNISIVVLPFDDRRDDTTNVGTVRNGFGMKTAPVRAENSVPMWIQDALVLDLRQAGFSVSTSASAPDSSLALGGEILKVYADAYFAYSAEVSLFVRLTREGREILGHSYVGTGSAGTNVTATAKSYAQSLALALADALRQVVPDVEKAIASE
jgi:hypothetical protein